MKNVKFDPLIGEEIAEGLLLKPFGHNQFGERETYWMETRKGRQNSFVIFVFCLECVRDDIADRVKILFTSSFCSVLFSFKPVNI